MLMGLIVTTCTDVGLDDCLPGLLKTVDNDLDGLVTPEKFVLGEEEGL